MPLYAATIFLSAFLLFQVQPLLAKRILPWFGGGAGIWTACMMFFQVFLLVGYAYAHGLSRVRVRWQMGAHIALMALSLAALAVWRIPPGDAWKPATADVPTWNILQLLLVHVGAPYLMLSSTGPLLQSWFSRTHPGRSPYRLYALSNAGSLLALLSYPFVFEPNLPLPIQGTTWCVLYVLYVVLCGSCAVAFQRVCARGVAPALAAIGDDRAAEGQAADRQGSGARRVLLWLALAATGSVMLLATTNRICQDVAVVPLLWVLPLAIYLATFIICFEHDRWYQRTVFLPLLIVSVAAAVHAMVTGPWDVLIAEILAYTVCLFACCMVCHGELVRLKPAAAGLTGFYLAVAAGGAAGGVFVAVIAPQLFSDYWEYHLGLFLTGVLAAVCTRPRAQEHHGVLRRAAWGAGAGILAALTVALIWHGVDKVDQATLLSRGFYGRLEIVISRDERDRVLCRMVHGRTMHGSQFRGGMEGEHVVESEDVLRLPTSYYGPDSAVGMVLSRRGEHAYASVPRRPLRIGMIGLGAGVACAYAKPGDYVRYYEINPEVGRLANEYFTFLDDARARKAQVDIEYGDARVVLEREIQQNKAQDLDVLIVDAFNSEAPPLHLITREALDVYWKHLKPDGVLLMQISNKHVNMMPVVRGLAQDAGRGVLVINSVEVQSQGTYSNVYALITSNRAILNDPDFLIASTQPSEDDPPPMIWTDDKTSLWRAVTHGHFEFRRWALPLHHGRFIVDEADLIHPDDEARMERLCRVLHNDSGGTRPLMVVTTQGIEERGLNEDMAFTTFAQHLMKRAGSIYPGYRTGLMLLICPRDREVTLQFGSRWPRDPDAFQNVLNGTIMAAVTSKDVSAGLWEGFAALERLVREQMESDRARQTEGSGEEADRTRGNGSDRQRIDM